MIRNRSISGISDENQSKLGTRRREAKERARGDANLMIELKSHSI